jgi:S-DNA-T family DNA segregation ATPase FtsK/SpoIIIE
MAEDDPDFVPLPKIVIFIDDLADLMMTSHSNEVEASIIRLAQMARAAGIHLIIGTQRPSVNVITGLIKANVPSRIAFAVASQTDSRVIMDIGGAEKLIGKGDMLYAPLDATKPMRIQGAFASDDDVEAVTEFIKANSGKAEYDSEFMSEIEREAERLSANDKKGNAEIESGEIAIQDADPLFTQALRIAVDSGTVATSFLQRKLSIGFGRAGKIIDRMEALGFVSAANGTKPRNVLITKQQLMEMEMAQDPRVSGNFG